MKKILSLMTAILICIGMISPVFASDRILEKLDSGIESKIDYYDLYLMGGDNNFKGYYNRGAGVRTRMEILDVAEALCNSGIEYCLSNLMEYDPEYVDGSFIDVSAVSRMRCDGLVEYAYETRGVRLQGTDAFWDISTVQGQKQHNVANFMQPRTQAQIMRIVDANP